MMHLKSLMSAPSVFSEASTEIFLGSRVRLARNLEGRSFPGWADEASRLDVLAECERVLSSENVFKDGWVLELKGLSTLEQQILVERHFISKDLLKFEQSAVLVSADRSVVVMINEEDHLRVQGLCGGYNLKGVWESVDALDRSLESKLHFAFDESLGYLTACPSNAGTGLRGSVMMHLPALVLSGHMEQLVRAMKVTGMVVRGIFGEGSDASGSIFQISNQRTLGASETSILECLSAAIDSVLEAEQQARAKLLKENPTRLLDQVGRACGVLTQARLLGSSEAMNVLGSLRLGVDLGLLDASERPWVDRLLMECQPGSVQLMLEKGVSNDAEPALKALESVRALGAADAGFSEEYRRDVFRATFLREELLSKGDLNWDFSSSV